METWSRHCGSVETVFQWSAGLTVTYDCDCDFFDTFDGGCTLQTELLGLPDSRKWNLGFWNLDATKRPSHVPLQNKSSNSVTLEGAAQPLQHSKLAVLLQAAQCEGWGSVHNRDPVMIGSFPHCEPECA